MDEIINKVAQSGLITIDPESIIPAGERVQIDISDQLWQGLALREKEFRDFVKNNDWEKYRDAFVAVTCSTDAIIPHWAFMLIASRLNNIARMVIQGDLEMLDNLIAHEAISQMDITRFRDARLVIKGCSDKAVPVSAYVALVNRLQPVAKSIMFGEPCSTVPIYKR